MKNSFIPISLIYVNLDIFELAKSALPLGRLAMQNNRVYFEYDSSFIKRGLNVSPFNLPLRSGLQNFELSLG